MTAPTVEQGATLLRARPAPVAVRPTQRGNLLVRDGELKAVYVHIPKTAGTSVRGRLAEHFEPCELAIPRGSWANARVKWDGLLAGRWSTRAGWGKHITARTLRAAMGRRCWTSVYTFAFVRNPWDVMVSSYHWWLRKASAFPSLRDDAEAVRRLGGFAAYLQSPFGAQINEFRGSIRDWLCGPGGRVLPCFVGRVETLGADWARVADALGIAADPPERLNAVARDDYRAFYTPETRALVARRFRWAIQRFDYAF